MNRTKIDWADFTWNPVIGCKHGCFYCYARRWAKRAGRDFNNPVWSDGQYRKPYKIKEPSKIFVCSLADLFGEWVSDEWIEKVLEVVKDNPQHTFQFLTKNPKRYSHFQFPPNCWLGATITQGDGLAIRDLIELATNYKNRKFVSIEPLLGSFEGIDLSAFDQVIVGAMTGPGAVEPKKEWVESVKHSNIFYKNNIKKYL